MPKVYAIHPGIGFARVGNHPDAFFFAPETPGSTAVDVAGDWAQTPLVQYRKDGQLKRQAARFRVFEYVIEEGQPVGDPVEVTHGERQIEWRVTLANRKGASRKLSYARPSWDSDANPAATLRNPTVIGAAEREAQLVIAPAFPPVSGPRQRWTTVPTGTFLGASDIYLGELRTDPEGRLVVLGGRGKCASVGNASLHWADSTGWYDDIADGPVEAVVIEADGTRSPVQQAWVITAPPDFAPGVSGLLTMCERAHDAGVRNGSLTAPTRPSFRDHIAPLLRRASALRWTADLIQPLVLSDTDIDQLGAAGTDPPVAARRATAYARFKAIASVITQLVQIKSLWLGGTPQQPTYMELWLRGDFDADLATTPSPLPLPRQLDQASLRQATGGGFFPGIEVGIRSTYPSIWSTTWPFRLIDKGETYSHVVESPQINETLTRTLVPGHMTERMAVPWQADFNACAVEEGTKLWWPSQRPDIFASDPGATAADPDHLWYEGTMTAWIQNEHWNARPFIKPLQRPNETAHIVQPPD